MLFNITKFMCEFCASTNCSSGLIWEDNFLSTCFLYSVPLNLIHGLMAIFYGYMTGVQRLPDALDRRIRCRKPIEKLFLAIKLLMLAFLVLGSSLDYWHNYVHAIGSDYCGILFISVKNFCLFLLFFYTYRSFKCFNYSFCRMTSLNLTLMLYMAGLLLQVLWLRLHMHQKRVICIGYVYIYMQFLCTLLYAALFNYTYLFQKRHSLYYESFADAQSTLGQANSIGQVAEEIEEQASLISKLTFSWVLPLLHKALQNQLRNSSDIFHIPNELNVEFVYEKVRQVRNELFPNQETFILWRLLWRSFKAELLLISNLKFFSDLLNFANPILLDQLMFYLESGQANLHGLICAFAMLIISMISAVLINLFDFYVNNVSIKMRCSILAMINKKLFDMNADTLHAHYSNGEIVNLTSVDTGRVMNVCLTLLQLFSMPSQIALALFLLYRQIGISFLSGFIFSLIVLPINKIICIRVGKLTTKMMEHKDTRVKLTSQLITGIKVIKMNNWQDLFAEKIRHERSQEMKYMKQRKYLDAICVYLWATTPVLISFLTFGTFVILGNRLTAPIVFTSLTLLNMLINPLNSFPWVVQGLVEAYVSVKRLQKFFNLTCQRLELNEDVVLDPDTQILMQNVCLQRDLPQTSSFTLGPLNLKIKKGDFIGIIGPIGSGKSSLLQAIAGELVRADRNGIFSINKDVIQNGIGYVPTQPYILNTSIRQNILFGKNYEYRYYHQVVDACALRPDFNIYEDNDNAMIGDRGLSLSGGQKARIGLARAIYQNFDSIYLIDDPFSSLDVHVAKHVYERCILKLLKGKTRIVCTHLYQYLKHADHILMLDKGEIVKVGTPDTLLDLARRKKSVTRHKSPTPDCPTSKAGDSCESFMFKEEMNEGVVKLSVYQKYFQAIGYKLFTAIMFFFLLMQFTRSFSDFWLSIWVDALKIRDDTSTFYLKIFLIATISNSVWALFRSFLFAYGGIQAAINMHNRLFSGIIRSKIQFFNVRPFGQIINRFSSDIYHVDDNLPFTLNIFLAQIVALMATVLITSVGVWILLFVFILLVYPYYLVQKYYRAASRDLKRICSNTLSPIYTHFSETLEGLTSIRCFNSQKRFSLHLNEKVDMNNASQYCLKACSQWLNLRLQFIALVISTSVAFIAAFQNHRHFFNMDPSLIGLALTYSLSLTSILNSVIQSFTQLEMDMISMERLVQYIENNEKESPDGRVMANFPVLGSIDFCNVSFRYKDHQALALDNVSFSIKPREFVGIVGRTGSGKSSLFQCLFRMYGLSGGQIFIDGNDISTLNVECVRRGMFIIPQDAFLFDGTVRLNLDPYDLRTDQEIWTAIEECDARIFVLKLGGLTGQISDQGHNLSAGEKQLICLIRALLHRVRVLCLDEATSSIDDNTEFSLHSTIKKAFRNSTILLIAHKISSVLNCDKIIVIENGRVGEINSPDKLIQDPKTLFFKMWNTMERK